jgi:hypothetical protein
MIHRANAARLAGFWFLAVSVGLAARAAGTNEQAEANEFRAHVTFLADDLLEGRAPGSRGGDVAAAYIASRFRAIGLEPAGKEYLQPVPLKSVLPNRDRSWIRLGATELGTGQHVVIRSEMSDPEITGEAETLFVGYGDHLIGAEEASLRGKVLLMLRGSRADRAGSIAALDRFKLELARSLRAAGVVFLLPEGEEVRERRIQAGWGQSSLAITAWLPRPATEPSRGTSA